MQTRDRETPTALEVQVAIVGAELVSPINSRRPEFRMLAILTSLMYVLGQNFQGHIFCELQSAVPKRSELKVYAWKTLKGFKYYLSLYTITWDITFPKSNLRGRVGTFDQPGPGKRHGFSGRWGLREFEYLKWSNQAEILGEWCSRQKERCIVCVIFYAAEKFGFWTRLCGWNVSSASSPPWTGLAPRPNSAIKNYRQGKRLRIATIIFYLQIFRRPLPVLPLVAFNYDYPQNPTPLHQNLHSTHHPLAMALSPQM